MDTDESSNQSGDIFEDDTDHAEVEIERVENEALQVPLPQPEPLVVDDGNEEAEEEDEVIEVMDSSTSDGSSARSTPIPGPTFHAEASTSNTDQSQTHNAVSGQASQPQNTSIQEFRSPKKYKVQSPPEKAAEAGGEDEESADEEAQCCPICFEPWENSGSHRLASLKCGHLFGQSCIEKWLKGQGGKCPHCNAKAQKKDIRVIYAKALKTVDTTERDQALKDLEREKAARRKAELEAAQARLRYQMAVDECNRMKQELERQRQQLSAVRSNMPGIQTPASPSKAAVINPNQPGYVFDRLLKIFEGGGCRVMTHNAAVTMLCVSQPSPNTLFPGYGIKKLNMLDMKSSQYVAVHTGVIRDVTFDPMSPAPLMLSCSMDKTVKVTNVHSNAVIQTYQTSQPLWSCVWNSDDNNYFFAGQSNGCVSMYDLRNTAEHVQVLNTEGPRSPVVSLQYVPHDPQANFRPGGLIVGQLNRAMFYERRPNQEFSVHALPLTANMTSLSAETDTRHLLATYRPTEQHPSVRHQLYELTSQNQDPSTTEQVCSCNIVHTFHGGRTQKFLSRNKIFPHPAGKGRLLVGTGDEASLSMHIWDVTTGLLAQKISTQGAPVIDICPLQINNDHYLLGLTEKQILLHKWR